MMETQSWARTKLATRRPKVLIPRAPAVVRISCRGLTAANLTN